MERGITILVVSRGHLVKDIGSRLGSRFLNRSLGTKYIHLMSDIEHVRSTPFLNRKDRDRCTKRGDLYNHCFYEVKK